MPPAAASGIPAKRVLASKEAALFKELLTLYETRQLKKGQKAADQILKKFPEHGETLCMKGLILTHMGKREEGLDLVKKGIRLDLTSHICWHVFGLIQKGEKNYEEALKSYTQALRFDKENMNILRDAASLQTQLRLFDSLVETRHTLLKLRPQLRQNWIALAVAYYLDGKLVDTKQVLEAYEKTLKNVPDYDIEHSEVLLYHVRVLEELNEYSEALSLLDVNAKSRSIVDRTSIMEHRARLLSQLGQKDEAEHAWRALIEQNPDCYDYYRGFLGNQDIDLDSITNENRGRALHILRELSQQIPKASAAQRIALDVAIDGDFKESIKPYLTSGLEKGVPSLFVDIKSLYQDSQKLQVVQDFVEDMRHNLSGAESSTPSSSSSIEPPTTYLWTLYFLAQHYSSLSQHSRALELLDEAISHTPTLPELLTCKARVLKRAGDPFGAARLMDEARLLDGQDRFLNTKCAKYRLRAGLVEEASEILGLFTKKDAASPGTDLEDMQSLLYLTEEGDAHERNGHLGLALKKYHAVEKVFNEVEDDQFDFHGYSLRKFTINIYLNLVEWEDQVRSHPAYIHAALGASRIYIRLHDDPSLVASCSAPAQLTDAAKKAKKKAKKAAQKVQEDAKKASPAGNEDKGLDLVPPKDDDPEGLKLVSGADHLERAHKLLAPLVSLSLNNIEVWAISFDVALRRSKYLQAAQALNTLRTLDAEHPELHIRIIEFHKALSPTTDSLPPSTQSFVTSCLSDLLPGDISLETFNSQYLQRHSASATHILACARVSRKLGAPTGEVEDLAFSLLKPEVALDLKSGMSALVFFKELNSGRIEEFRSACDLKFPLACTFKTPSELAALRQNGFTGNLEVEEKQEQEVLS
ncbi:hypothetical protein JAAARDRAFT_174177 [Jaapia argillacea MUCL 33604]|uniref:Uncharacterized protein n=1 Tax=Jaapia argillacea MUCL 33604 TaxID=933084 RepID=A0A067Q9H2_9AGAM|nr:hypothetical protein JAAARDRAFT_174177 [Jaapia argillacea MUCL 33604]